MPSPKPDRRTVAVAALIVVGTAAVYFPSLMNGFAGLDDDVYITANPLIASLSPSNLWAILTHPYAEFYHPVTLLSLALDRAIWGYDPFGYHLTDFLLHLLNTVLVFWICYALAGIGARAPAKGDTAVPEASGASAFPRTAAAVAAALFALHPLRAESVAWAAQRKDLLCGFFYLLAFGLYLRHAAAEPRRLSRASYRLALLAFLLALLSKSMALTLPVALVIVDYYPLRRLRGWPGRGLTPNERGVWLEKLPFFGLAAAMAVATLAAQRMGGSLRSAAEIPWSLRPWLVVHSYAFYLWKTLVPIHLTVLYPIPLQAGVRDAATWLSAAAVLGLTLAAWRLRKRWPAVTAAWVFYLVTLAPVSGLLTFGAQSVADRYGYLPLLGLELLAGLGVAWINRFGDESGRPALRTVVSAAAALTLVVLGFTTIRQVQSWRDGESLWLHHLRWYPENVRARFNLGYFYQSHGRLGLATWAYERALRGSPHHFDTNLNFGALLLRENDPESAEVCFRRAVETRPAHPGAHLNLGLALVQLQRPDEALAQFHEAVRLDPKFADGHAALGQAEAERGNIGAAIREWREALRLNPRLAPTHESLGLAYLALGETELARREFEWALRFDAQRPDALIELARMDAASSHPLVALGRLDRAAGVRPDDPEIQLLKAEIVRRQGALSLAESSLRQALSIDPDCAEAYHQLGLLLEQKNRLDESLAALIEARLLFQDEETTPPAALLEAFDRVDAKLRKQETGR